MIMGVVRAELRQLRGRAGIWAAGVVWLLQVGLFAYFVQFMAYRNAVAKPDPVKADALLHTLIPEALAHYNASLYPLYGSAIAVIVGALVGGGDFRWRTTT